MKEPISFGITADKLWIGWSSEEGEATHRQFYRLDKITGVYVHTYKKRVNKKESSTGEPRGPDDSTEWVEVHDVTINVIGEDGGATVSFFDERHSAAFVGLCLGDAETIEQVEGIPK